MMTLEEFQKLLKQSSKNPTDIILLQTLFLELVRRQCDPRKKNNLIIKTLNEGNMIISIPKNACICMTLLSPFVVQLNINSGNTYQFTYRNTKERDEVVQRIIDFLS